jgi:membrane protein implicated in regulation of membrane protease activity
MRTFLRYLLFQVPGWILLGLFVWLLLDWGAIPLWVAQALFGFWVVKDLAMYPWVRRAYEREPSGGAATLVGVKGVALNRLAPEGYVKVKGELWRARAEPSDRPIEPQTAIRVRGAEGMRLIVERESSGRSQEAPRSFS